MRRGLKPSTRPDASWPGGGLAGVDTGWGRFKADDVTRTSSLCH